MTETQSFIDLLSTNLAHVFHRYLFVRKKQICSHQVNSIKNSFAQNSTRKVRINRNKYSHLLKSISKQEENNNNIALNDNKLSEKKTSKKSKKANIERENKQQASETINTPSPTSSSINQITTRFSGDSTSNTDDHQSSEVSRISSSSSTRLTVSETSSLKEDIDSNHSTLYVAKECREKLKYLYNMKPIVNRNYINTQNLPKEFNLTDTFEHRKMKQYSKELKPDQLFRCPKDSRSKRRKCCGVYYELFDDAWRLLEGWFTTE